MVKKKMLRNKFESQHPYNTHTYVHTRTHSIKKNRIQCKLTQTIIILKAKFFPLNYIIQCLFQSVI